MLAGKPINLGPATVTTHGETSLPLIGGVSHSLVDDPSLNFPEHIGYGRCETFAEGRYNGNVAITTVRASVDNVRLTTSPSPTDNVPDVKSISFQVGNLSIQIQSVYPLTGQPSVTVNPSYSQDMALVVSGKSGDTPLQIKLAFDQQFLSLSTVQEMDDEFLGNRQFFDEFVQRFTPLKNLVFGSSKIPRTPRGYVLGSFVRQIQVGSDPPIPGNVLTMKGFGTIKFGLVIAGPSDRRFTMARIKMGSDPAGQGAFGAVNDTGDWGN